MSSDHLRHDNGYRSRKMVMSYACLVLISLGFLASGKWPDLKAVYSEYIMGVLAAASIYVSGNSFTKWMSVKAGAPEQQPSSPPTPAAPAHKSS